MYVRSRKAGPQPPAPPSRASPFKRSLVLIVMHSSDNSSNDNSNDVRSRKARRGRPARRLHAPSHNCEGRRLSISVISRDTRMFGPCFILPWAAAAQPAHDSPFNRRMWSSAARRMTSRRGAFVIPSPTFIVRSCFFHKGG